MVTEEDTFEVSSNFIGDFKLGDNINHTLRVLLLLYRSQRTNSGSDAEAFCKPIIIFIASICEAILYDLLCVRIKYHTREGVRDIAKNVADCIRRKNLDKFGKYIDNVKKYYLLDGAKPRIYDSLENLRKLRNRIHIQNGKGDLERDDSEVFTMERQVDAEKTLEQTIKFMADKYPRPASMNHVNDFELPWDEHFPAQ
jgi:hypothetical protein